MRKLEPYEIVQRTDIRYLKGRIERMDYFQEGCRADSPYWYRGSTFHRKEETNMKTKLPTHINFSSPELALVAAEYLKSKGFIVSSNLAFSTQLRPGSIFTRPDTRHCLRIYESAVASDLLIEWDSTTHRPGAPLVSSLQEFFDLVEEKPLKVGDYFVEFKDSGVQVGCTFVDKATVKEIHERLATK